MVFHLESDFELSSYVRQKYHFFHFGEAKNEKSFPSAASQRCDAYDRVEESDLFLMEVKRLKLIREKGITRNRERISCNIH